jgi:hypothetical protein
MKRFVMSLFAIVVSVLGVTISVVAPAIVHADHSLALDGASLPASPTPIPASASHESQAASHAIQAALVPHVATLNPPRVEISASLRPLTTHPGTSNVPRAQQGDDRPTQLSTSLSLSPTIATLPVWKTLLLVYHNTDVDYVDTDGTPRHLTATMPQHEMLQAMRAYRQYASLAHRFSGRETVVLYDVVHITRPITSVSSLGEAGYWVSPSDSRLELDQYAPRGTYDSVLVHWMLCDPGTNQCVPSYGWGWGLRSTEWANGATYATVTNAPDENWAAPTVGEPWLHEWLHGVCDHFTDRGFVMPTHCADGGGFHGYTWSPERGWSDFYRDLMTGRVLENGEYRGMPPTAWRTGAIVGQRSSVVADYYDADSLSSYQTTGTVVWQAQDEQIALGSATGGDHRMYLPVPNGESFTMVGRASIPASGVGHWDSVALALRGNEVEYWATLAYGTDLVERNHISLMRNDTWGELAPVSLTPGWYTIKVFVDYEGDTIRMKTWADGANEPGWQVSRSLDPQWVATQVGFRHAGQGTLVDDLLLTRELLCLDFLPPTGVGTEDIQAIAGRWSQTTTTPGWDAKYDLNKNGRIDVLDVMRAATAWGGACP